MYPNVDCSINYNSQDMDATWVLTGIILIYVMEYYSAIKKNEIMPFATPWMDLEIIILSEVSQREKDKYDITYMWTLKRWYKNSFTK